MKKRDKCGLILFMVCIFLLSFFGSIHAEGKKDMGGWGLNDLYNKFYDAGNVEQRKVVVVDVQEIVPLPEMSPGVALVVKEDEEGEELLVHLCPVWYKTPEKIGIRKGDKISLRGYSAEINGEDVIMAAKLKKKGKTFKVRLTSDGTPFWTMTPAQLQKELSSE